MTPREGSAGSRDREKNGGTAERHRLERELARLHRRVAKLERENAEIAAAAAVVAHELVEPLVIIELHAAMLASEDRDRATLSADGIGRAAARLRRLAEAVLLDARAGDAGIARRDVDLATVLRDVLELLAADLEAHGATVVAAGTMPIVQGDEALLRSLLMNLVTNALKYGRRENATIAIEAQRIGDEWQVTVTDDGAPIPDDERALIFEPFKRAHRERRARGAGLGLSIARRTVERHGGRIGLLPAEHGNCFYFTLPA